MAALTVGQMKGKFAMRVQCRDGEIAQEPAHAPLWRQFGGAYRQQMGGRFPLRVYLTQPSQHSFLSAPALNK